MPSFRRKQIATNSPLQEVKMQNIYRLEWVLAPISYLMITLHERNNLWKFHEKSSTTSAKIQIFVLTVFRWRSKISRHFVFFMSTSSRWQACRFQRKIWIAYGKFYLHLLYLPGIALPPSFIPPWFRQMTSVTSFHNN